MKATTLSPGQVIRNILANSTSRKVVPLDSQSLCAEARRQTGLTDFGNPPIEPALSTLVESLEREANLHPLGRFLMRMHLRGLLETRLRLEKAWGGHLKNLDQSPLLKPIFITGMPRSGSTFLHELLAEDSSHRVPRVWEVMFPVANGNPAFDWLDQRVWRSEVCLWWFRQLAPGADSVHPLRARTPHECVAIHSYTLLSEEFVSLCRIPGYETYLHGTDLYPAYAWEKRFLQHLQWQSPAKRWVLKSPDHAYGLEALFSVFPDALVIQTHRNPMEVLRSLCKLSAVLHGLFGDTDDGNQLVEREARLLSSAMEKFMQFRDRHPELASHFVDVNYSDLVADPLAVLRRIYRRFDMSWSEKMETQARQLAWNRSRYSGRWNAPSFARTSFDLSEQIGRFSQYCQRFGIHCEHSIVK